MGSTKLLSYSVGVRTTAAIVERGASAEEEDIPQTSQINTAQSAD